MRENEFRDRLRDALGEPPHLPDPQLTPSDAGVSRGYPRGMALLPQWAARLNPVTRIPSTTTIITGVFVALWALVGDAAETYDLTNIGTLFAFILVCIGVVVLRRTDASRPRPFRVPFVPVFPILGVIFCIALMLSLPVLTWIRFFVWLVIGLVIYFLYGAGHSKLRRGIDTGDSEDIVPPIVKT